MSQYQIKQLPDSGANAKTNIYCAETNDTYVMCNVMGYMDLFKDNLHM